MLLLSILNGTYQKLYHDLNMVQFIRLKRAKAKLIDEVKSKGYLLNTDSFNYGKHLPIYWFLQQSEFPQNWKIDLQSIQISQVKSC
jgi:hypothetical protein